jgi:glycosyltransferase involved in cell wall biosynthesis
MKIALGIIVKNEAKILKKTLPTYAHLFAHKYAIDYGSTDKTVEILKKHDFKVAYKNWTNDFSEARNNLITWLEQQGMDAVVMLDADEAITDDGFFKIRELLQTYKDKLETFHSLEKKKF